MFHLLDPLRFPLQGVRLIEASAGTGKTYTLTALYLRLVLGHGGEENGFFRPLLPPEILVVTFTNAATEELRDRIRRRLTEAAAFFRNQHNGDPYLTDLRNEFSCEQWQQCANRMELAAQWMDESAIHTIHSWCQRMLNQHAFDSTRPFDLKLEKSDEDLLETAVCDYWRCHIYPLSKDEVREYSRLTGIKTPQELLKRIRPLLRFTSSTNAFDTAEISSVNAPSHSPFGKLQKYVRTIEDCRREWEKDFEAAVDTIRQAQACNILNKSKYRTEFLSDMFDQMENWVKLGDELPELKVLEKFSASGLSSGVRKNQTAPEHPAYQALDQLINQVKDHHEVRAAFDSHAATDMVWRIREEKLRTARTGFDDLLTGLNDALQASEHDRLAEVIRKQFPVAMIDEFQDTDPVQYAIFSKIYMNSHRVGLFMIGDPKQAIYAFRGADVHTYLAARRQTDAHTCYSLGENFRSTEGMVKSVNQIFRMAASWPEGAFLFKDDIPFHEAAARGRMDQFTVQGQPVNGMNFWMLQQSEPVAKTGRSGYLYRMAEATAGEIVRLLNLAAQQPAQAGFQTKDGNIRALRPADIAILVRSYTEARIIREALYARQVYSVYLSDRDSVFNTKEAESILYLLHASAEPEQERAVKAALATDVLMLPLSRLDLLNQDESAWEDEVVRFRRSRHIWRSQGVLPMLRMLLMEFNVPERLLSIPGGERVLTNVLHLAELLQTASARLDGEHALIRWMTEQIQHPAVESDETILRLESDESLVKVITFHKSKGLEYPLVYLPFICTFKPADAAGPGSPVITRRDVHGRMEIVQNPQSDDYKAADRDRLAEDLRILYVAVTRPQYACWLGVGVMDRQPLHQSALGYLLSGGETISPGDLPERLEAMKGDCPHIFLNFLPELSTDSYQPCQTQSPLLPAAKFSGTIFQNWWIASYSVLIHDAGSTPSGQLKSVPGEPAGLWVYPDAPGSAIEEQLKETETSVSAVSRPLALDRSIHGFPKGPEPGTFLHSLMEWAAKEGFLKLVRSRQAVSSKIQSVCRSHGWEDWVDVLTDWLMNLLQTEVLLPDTGYVSLSSLSLENCRTELEFLLAVHDVDTLDLDRIVKSAILPEAFRPGLNQNRINGMLKGFIDLVFCHHGRYYVVDYKSNHLGENEQAYTGKAMIQSVLEHRYDLQYTLYTLAVHRLLKSRMTGYDYHRDMGGVLYLFLRGVTTRGEGVYADKPPQSLIEQLDNCFAGKEHGHAD